MTENDRAELIELLNIYMKIIEANKGVQGATDLRFRDAEGLAIKLFNHVTNAIYVYRGITIPELMWPIKNYPDPSSLNVLVRAAFETLLVFYFIFCESNGNDEIDFKYFSWELSGLYLRQKFPAALPESIEKLKKEKNLIIQLENKIKNNLIFQGMTQKQKENYFKRLERSNWRSKGWAEIALSAGFSELNSKWIYSLLSDHAHSGIISATQISQSADYKVRMSLMEGSFAHLLICVANMIRFYCMYFPNSKKYYSENYKEPNVVSFWIDIGSENLD